MVQEAYFLRKINSQNATISKNEKAFKQSHKILIKFSKMDILINFIKCYKQ